MIMVIPQDCIQFGEQLQIFENVENLDMNLIKSWHGNINDTKRHHRKWITSLKRRNSVTYTLEIRSSGTNSHTSSTYHVHLIKPTLPSCVLSACLTYPMEDKVPPWVRSVPSYFTEAMRHSLSTLSTGCRWAVCLHIEQYHVHEN